MLVALKNIFKNKKAAESVEMESINSLILWIVFLLIAAAAVYYIFKKLSG